MRRLRLLLSPNLAVLVVGVALAAGATQLPDRREADLRIDATSAGRVAARTVHVSDAAGFTLARLVPGDRGTGTITLTNRGDGVGAYDLVPEAATDVLGAGGGRLSRQLELAVQDVTDPAAPRLLFAGKVGALDLPVAVGDIAAGASRTLRVTVDWEDAGPADDVFIGASTGVVYKFRVTRPDPVPAVVPVVGQASSARACISRRRFPITVRVPRGFRVRSTRVFVDGVRVKVLAGARPRAIVDLRGKVRARVRVEIAVRGASGRTLVGARTYRTCLTRSGSRRPARTPKL